MFRGIPPIKLDSSLAAASHVQSLVVTLVLSRQDYVRKHCIDWPSDLFSMSSTVGTECMADQLHEIRGPHQRHSCLPSLAVCPRVDRLQGCCADTQSFTWNCGLLPLIRVVDLPKLRTLHSWQHQSFAGVVCQAFNIQWLTGLSWTLLDLVSGTLCNISVTLDLPSTT